MSRKTMIAIAVFIALGVVVVILERTPRRGVRSSPRKRPLPAVEAKRIDRLAIVRGGHRIVIGRRGDASAKKDSAWAVREPLRYPADDDAVQRAVDTLAELEFGELVTERSARHAALEVDGKHGIRVTAFAGRDKLFDAYLGKVQSGFTMLRGAASPRVYQVIGDARAPFDRDLELWRDRSIVRFEQQKARELMLSGPSGAIALVRKDPKGAWTVRSSSAQIASLDRAAVADLLSTLAGLTASSFADEAKPSDVGLDQPRARVTVKPAGLDPITVLVGAGKDDDGRYVKRADRTQLFLIDRHAAQRLLSRPIDFADKTILSFKPGDVRALIVVRRIGSTTRRVKLTRKRGDAWLGNGKPVASAARIQEALQALGRLRAARIARHTRAELGMSKPSWRLQIQLADQRHDLIVGSSPQGGRYGVSIAGRDRLYAIEKQTLDRITVDPVAHGGS